MRGTRFTAIMGTTLMASTLLCQAGADVTSRNSQGLNVEALARKNGHQEVAAFLRGAQ